MASTRRAGRRLPRLLLLATSLALAVGLVPAPTAAAAAEELVARQEVFSISGHGWGHGRGMSQHGARGAAQAGLTYRQVLGFYYPGTTLSAATESEVRILLSGDAALTQSVSSSLDVAPAGGLTATDLSTGRSLLLPTGPDRWRVVRGAGGLLVLQARTSGTWRDQVLAGTTTAATAGPISLAATGAVLRRWYPGERSRDYRGTLRAMTRGTGLAVVGHLPLEQYLRSVVPAEMPSSWHAQALASQAVAARSYSSWKRADSRRRLPSQPWDLCDSTRCQVYAGVSAEVASTDAAVSSTARQVLLYAGAPVLAEFSSSNGGWTTAGSQPYQVAKPDPYDGLTGASVHAWTALLRATDLERRFPAVGRLVRLRITSRDGHGDWGGRVQGVVLDGVDGAGRATSVTTTGREVYLAAAWPARTDGLRSSWWTVDTASDPVGSVDAVASGVGVVQVRGWTLDPSTWTSNLAHVYVDGRFARSLTADQVRADVGRLHGRGDRHGYSTSLVLPEGRHDVCVHGINVAGTAGTNRLLGCRSVTARHTPIGVVDAVTAGTGSLALRGWTLDPDVTGPVRVHVYVDGALVTSAAAAGYRSDVARVFPAYGAAHGYALTVKAARGTHAVCVVAHNVTGTPGSNRRLECRTVTV